MLFRTAYSFLKMLWLPTAVTSCNSSCYFCCTFSTKKCLSPSVFPCELASCLNKVCKQNSEPFKKWEIQSIHWIIVTQRQNQWGYNGPYNSCLLTVNHLWQRWSSINFYFNKSYISIFFLVLSVAWDYISIASNKSLNNLNNSVMA